MSTEKINNIHAMRGICILAGLLTALPFNFSFMAPLGWLSVAPLVWTLLKTEKRHGHPLRRAYSLAFCFFFTFYLGIYFWFLYMYPLSFTGLSPLAAAAVVGAGWFGLSLLQAAVFSLIGPLFILLRRRAFMSGHRGLLALSFPALWTVFEWLQSLTWAGVPFARLAVGQQALLPAIQSASLLGSLFVGFLMVSVGSFAAFAFRHALLRRRFAIVAAAVFILNFGFGCTAMLLEPQGGETITAAALQGNISSTDKWNDMTYEEIRDVYLELCSQAAKRGARLLVIPESAIPADFNISPALLTPFTELAREKGVSILLGGFWQGVSGKTGSYNAIYCINSDGTVGKTPYFKRRLVPFGEYVPMRSFFETVFPPLTEINMLREDSGQGSDSNLHDSSFGTIGSLVCFDSIYDTLARDSVRDGAQLLTVSTNDSWFFDSPALYEHLGHSVLRAVENGRCVVRAANTGVSAIISPIGVVKEQLSPLERGFAISEVTMNSGKTLYSHVGNLIVPLCATYLLLILLYPCRRRKAAMTKGTADHL